MNAYGVSRDKLQLLLQRAVSAGLRVSKPEFKDRNKDTAELRFLFHCSAVVNTQRNARSVWMALANRHKIPIRLMDPVVQNATEEGEQLSELSENELAEVFDAAPSVDGSKLQKLGHYVQRYLELETEQEALDEQSSARGKELSELRMHKIPEIMREARILQQDMDSGHRVSLGTAIAGSWPKDEAKRAIALRALEKLNSTDLVKQTVTVTFAPEDHKVAGEVIKYLKRKKVQVEVDRTVHPMTYRAWAKEMLSDPKTAPIILSLLGELGILVMDQATVKQIKDRKKR